jgi:hypothetical protein
VDTSFVGIFSAVALRGELYSGITALSYLCSRSACTPVPNVWGQQKDQEEQETSMDDLLQAILEQEGFLGAMYY